MQGAEGVGGGEDDGEGQERYYIISSFHLTAFTTKTFEVF